MPFKNQRNSRDDNSKKQRNNSESFKSKGSQGKRSTNTKGDSYSKFSSGSDDKSAFSHAKRSGKPFTKKFDDKGEKGFEHSEDKPRNFKSFSKTDDKGFAPRKGTGRPFEKKFDDRENKPKGFKASGKPFEKKFDDKGGKPRSFGPSSRSEGRTSPSGRKFSERPYEKRVDAKGESKDFDNSEEKENRYKIPGKRKFSPAQRPASRTNEDDGTIRLNRYISNSGICSRRKADELIEAGVISVNGEVVTELGTKVDPAKDEIRYNNERLKREKMVYVLLNKPKDYITTTDDPQERKTVMQLVSKATKERIYPVGRLDRNTTGLLLLTNDGSLAEKLSHPRNNVSKIYNIELDKNLTQGDFNKIEFGIELEDGIIKPDDISYVQGASKREVGIQIHSGKNRIVRRIFESLGYEVIKLDRVVYANLTKKDLPRGRWRYLEERELIQLKHLIK
ncbi:rRNA pseudouridine synthase [Sphingobacterium olei]|uniref:Pseudouridine synthase n=1 Tax=Sphingobacterium olei TaxID=2571155 RepID=A0A4V5MJV8_9SPHI|nr:pseudouridine synthase [Sphingobacterium olei]TJZ50778.1 rRNA pseudouridine synthase [Sphingobacterium olei]